MPKIKIQWLNCMWLLVPLLMWNIILAPKIELAAILSDAHSPAWLLMAENIIRVIVFAFPLLLPLRVKNGMIKTGLVIYLAGTLIYFASWIPIVWAPDSVWSQSTIGLLAPRLTPLLSFLGIALVGQSIPYAVMSVIFIALHTLHGIQNLGS
jgi:hypothetical protein